MAGSANDDNGNGTGRSSDGTPGWRNSQSGDAITEWRSCEQVANDVPSTSPPYWDTDGDDDDGGLKPSELYGKFTWKIENFSQISKKELRSNAFEVGGYKWYILIYPQGCDVCNHLSLFLCVANHDKLLPGWSHFAQFTIAVVNKDPKKSKYSDTLHRFWKKEHDWGWKKFMEISKVLDGFLDSEADTLLIKAQVQVIRERADRPFRCLDVQYRRELVRVYLTNVEQICRRFVEERRGMLVKFIEDKARWASFCTFWAQIGQCARGIMSREKTDVILRTVVKQFFIEKEVTSTLVMDSLYSGLKALECRSNSKKEKAKLLDTVETPAPIVCIENDMFILADDVLVLLERASVEPLPPKNEKGPQNRTKDGSSGEDSNKDFIVRDERRLTELGRRTIEIFVLAHIFSGRIEVAHQELVALRKQEELIREEEAAGQAESEQKAKRGATEKEKRAKKKQSKHKRSSRKAKDKGKDEKSYASVQDKQQRVSLVDVYTGTELAMKQEKSLSQKPDTLDDLTNSTDTGDDVSDIPQHELEDRDTSTVNWDTDASDIHPGIETSCSGISSIPVQKERVEKNTSVMDDSSSTFSTDSVLSMVMNGNYKGDSIPNYKIQTSPNRWKKKRGKETRDVWSHGTENQLAEPVSGSGHQSDASRSCTAIGSESESVLTLKDRIKWLEHHLDEKHEEVVTLQKKLVVKDQVDVERPSKQMMAGESLSSLNTPSKNPPSDVLLKPVIEDPVRTEPVPVCETLSNSHQKTEKAIPLSITSTHNPSISKPKVQNVAAPSKYTSSHIEKPKIHQAPVTLRPSSASTVLAPKPPSPVVSMVHTAPSLARSVSAAGRLGTDPSSATATHSYHPPSYKNAIMGKTMGAGMSGFSPPSLVSLNPSPLRSQPPPALIPSARLSPQSSAKKDQSVAKSDFTFGSVTQEVLQNRPLQVGESSQSSSSSTHCNPSLISDVQNLNMYGTARREPRTSSDELSTSVSARQAPQGLLAEEFPHLDIINYLLDEEQHNGRAARDSAVFNSPNSGRQHQLNRQYTFPGDIAMLAADVGPAPNSCRFDRLASYHDDGMHPVYGASGAPFDGLRNTVPHVGMSAFANGQQPPINRVLQNEWPTSSAHAAALHRTRNTEGDLYPYQIPDYSNMSHGGNGYTMFRPSSGR